MLNLLRRFLRPTLREQLEDGVREALKRYTDRRTAPDLRVYVSTDLVPEGMDRALWSRDEADHLRRFAAQWAQDNGIARAGMRVELIMLDTKREFAFVKPVGLEGVAPGAAAAAGAQAAGAAHPHAGQGAPLTPASGAVLEYVSGPRPREPLRVGGELILGRRAQEGVAGLDDRYMSGRHARLHAAGGRLWVTDLDSKNRTYVNDAPLTPHDARELAAGDLLRVGTTVLRVTRLEA